MCGTIPPGHWWAKSVSISVQRAVFVEVPLAKRGQAESQFHWKG